VDSKTVLLINIGIYIVVLMAWLPIIMLAIEVFAAITLKEKTDTSPFPRPRIAVLIPAHNEEASIEACLNSIRPQLTPADKIVVVADNCDDSTADIAIKMGARVIARTDHHYIGKSYAIDYGISHLASDPPDIAIIIDADVIAKPGAIERIAGLAYHTGSPVQASYLLTSPKNAGATSMVSAFAFYFKNLIRPLGLSKLGLPCLLTGSGMAIPWSIISAVAFKSGSIVEDLKLAVDLAAAGYSPKFCPKAEVIGSLPKLPENAMRQRIRWEHGHLKAIFGLVPLLILKSVRHLRLDLLILGLDLMIPPLSFLTIFWIAITLVIFLLFVCNISSWMPLAAVTGSGFFLGISIFSGWFFFARDILPFRILLAAPVYAATKIPIYLKFLIHPETKWIRTARDETPPDPRKKNKNE